MTIPRPYKTTVHTNAELFELWQKLMGPGGFGRRSLWLLFLDVENRVLPTIVPIDDIPAEPDPLFTGNIAKIISDLVSSGVAASVAMLLSRSGPGTMTAQDRQWARALRLGKHRWPIHLATCDRVQVFAPDDLVAAS